MVDRGNFRRTNSMPANPMNKLREIDFAIWETALYLDAYPKCRRALEYYTRLTAERERRRAQMNAKAPLTAFENKNAGEWNWVKGPWPWEPDAN